MLFGEVSDNGRFRRRENVILSDRLFVQVGDEVALVSGDGDYLPRRVASVFASGEASFALEDSSQYTAEGFEVGRDRTGRVLAMTDAVRAHIQRLEHLKLLRNLDWRRLVKSSLVGIGEAVIAE